MSISERAADVIRNRKTKVQSWFLDLNLVMGYWGKGAKRSYHHTAPVNALYGLHESLVMLQEEGLENSWARHALNHRALRDGLEAMGISFLVEESARLPQLNTVIFPEGVDEASVRSRLLSEMNLEIGAGLGDLAGKVWRIGLMGAASSHENVIFCVSAIEAILCSMNAPINKGVALAAAEAAYTA